MGPVPDNESYFDPGPAEDTAQYPQSQDGETLLSNSWLKSFSCRPSAISHIRQALADPNSGIGFPADELHALILGVFGDHLIAASVHL